jgi:hypothetical protein
MNKLIWEELISAPTPKTIINEPIDFVVDFAVEEPKRESATARAMRQWFKQNPTVETSTKSVDDQRHFSAIKRPRL